jgi:hypothetical protein
MSSLEIHNLVDRALLQAAAYTDARVENHERMAVGVSGVLAALLFGVGVLVGVAL